MLNDVAVCIPWRAQPSRIPAYQLVRQFWERMGWPVYEADSGDGPFNRSRARNLAVRRVDSDIVILADADTLPEIAPVRKAVNTIGEEAVWPFTSFRLIDHAYVMRADFREAPAVEGESWQHGPVTGGVIVCRFLPSEPGCISAHLWKAWPMRQRARIICAPDSMQRL